MSSIRKVTLVGGTGRLGPHLLQALLDEPNFELTVINRKNSSLNIASHPRLNIVTVGDDYPDDEVVEAFAGQDAVVLSLSFAAQQRQKALAEASIKAGVKFFIANHWGGADTKEVKEFFPIAVWKDQMVDELKALEQAGARTGWKWSAIAPGLFFDFCLSTPFFGIDPKQKKCRLIGSGDIKFSASNFAFIGQALIKLLQNPEEASDRVVFVASFETSLNEILEAQKKVVGQEGWEVSYVDVDEVIATSSKAFQEKGDFMALGRLALCSVVKPRAGSDFRECSILENKKFGLQEKESVEAAVARVLRESIL
ncbi:hypothetical protein BDV96DRAFT_631227 [Lophiotrema nucula]|uniref:NAD(P)-binding domain-containing protein n=1 Tax=Lophiotrema nucula TaxID=690887 RepID=A0A6A5ZA14_9PLEO|nr:hypothetical protein BDV96DRAFT_631227 [Lophiotrema nucula]